MKTHFFFFINTRLIWPDSHNGAIQIICWNYRAGEIISNIFDSNASLSIAYIFQTTEYMRHKLRKDIHSPSSHKQLPQNPLNKTIDSSTGNFLSFILSCTNLWMHCVMYIFAFTNFHCCKWLMLNKCHEKRNVVCVVLSKRHNFNRAHQLHREIVHVHVLMQTLDYVNYMCTLEMCAPHVYHLVGMPAKILVWNCITTFNK